ncbi:TPA_asm: UL10 uORF, partial [Human alphaherpesvirus 1]
THLAVGALALGKVTGPCCCRSIVVFG